MRQDASAVMMESFEDAGAEYVFGLPGSVIMNTIDKITALDMEFISTRHEQVATTMADGYARVTGQPGISLAHVGPGAANQIVGVGAAYRDVSPVIAISGNEDMARLGRDVWHEWDVGSVFAPFTKWNTRIERPEDAARITRQAMVKSVSGRPGPVHIDLPKEVSSAEVEYDAADKEFYSNHEIRVPFERPRPDSARVKETIRLLRDAERPLILAGGGCIRSGASEALATAVDRLGVPVVTSPSGRGVLPDTHPLCFGLVGNRGTDAASEALERADLVVGVGARFSALTTKNWDLIGKDTSIVQVEVEPGELASQYPVDVTVFADARSFVEDLVEAAEADTKALWSEEEVDRTKAAVDAELDEFFDYPDADKIGPRQFYAVLQDERDDDAIISMGGGVHSAFGNSQRTLTPEALVTATSFGSMGYGFPMALGAKLGAPDRQVLCVEGDGGFAMVMQDLETMVRYGIDVKVIIYNNFSHGSQKMRQGRFFDERYLGTDVGNPRFDELAEVFGVYGRRAEKPSELREAVRDVLDHDGPAVLDTIVDPWIWPDTEKVAQIPT